MTGHLRAPAPVAPARFLATSDLAGAIALWQEWLTIERRASPHTGAAYGRDLAAFLDFLGEHRGETPSLAALAALVAGDFRAYLARRAADGLRTALDRAGVGGAARLLPLPRSARPRP